MKAENLLAAVRAAVFNPPAGASDGEVLNAIRFLLRDNSSDPVAEVERQMQGVKTMKQAMREQGFA